MDEYFRELKQHLATEMKEFTFKSDDYNHSTTQTGQGQLVINGYEEAPRNRMNSRTVYADYWHHPDDGTARPNVPTTTDVVVNRQVQGLNPTITPTVIMGDDIVNDKADEVIASVPESPSGNGWYYAHEIPNYPHGFHSINNDRPFVLAFVNLSDDDINYYRVNHQGVVEKMGTLGSYQSTHYNTFFTHPWVFKTHEGE